jgi:ribosomal protein S18 acetylase RimI-like enzyme
MPLPSKLLEPASAADWEQASALLRDYADALDVDVYAEGFADELLRLPIRYGAPRGAFLVAMLGGRPVGCVALRAFDDDRGEVKRLYVTSAARGLGLGRALAAAIIERARDLGYRRLVLDTLVTMGSAQALYRSLGFRPIAAYYQSPHAGTLYLGLNLEE